MPSKYLEYQDKLTKILKENLDKEFGNCIVFIQFSGEAANEEGCPRLQFIKLTNLPTEEHVINILDLYIASSIHKIESVPPLGAG